MENLRRALRLEKPVLPNLKSISDVVFGDIYSKLVVVYLVLGSVIFSFLFLNHLGLRLDESQSLYVTGQSFGNLIEIIGNDVHVPLYLILLKIWRVFWDLGNLDVAGVRSFSLIFHLLSIIGFYKLTVNVFVKKRTAYFGTLLFSASPMLLWFANELRMYSLMVLVTIASHYTFYNFWKDRDNKKYLILYGLTALVGIYVHYYFNLVLLSQFVFLLWNYREFGWSKFIRLITVYVYLGVAYVPWIFFMISNGAGQNMKPFLAAPTTVDVFNTLAHLTFGFQSDYINTLLVSSWPLLTLLALIAMCSYKKKVHTTTKYLIVCSFLPILLVYLVSVTLTPAFLSRYMIVTLPSIYMLIILVTEQFRGRSLVWLRSFLVTFFMVGLGFQTFNYNTPVKERYREAAQYINSNADKNDIVLLAAPFTIFPFENYYRNDATLRTVPTWSVNNSGPIPEFDKEVFETELYDLQERYENIYLLTSYDQGYEEDMLEVIQKNYRESKRTNFSFKLNLYEFDLTNAVSSN